MTLSKAKLQLVRRLFDPRQRPREECFVVEGTRGGMELLDGALGLEPQFAVVSPRLGTTELGRTLGHRLESSTVSVEEVSDGELDDLSATERSQGVLLVVREPSEPSLFTGPEPPRRLLVLDGVQDPGNAGTLIRAGFAFGLDGVIALDGTVDPYNAKVVRAAAGALANVPTARMTWELLADRLEAGGISILAADPGGEDVRGMEFDPPWALVIGNEGAGPRLAVREGARRTLAIKMARAADSLNAGVAGAILLFALSRSHDALEE